jgi:ribosomal protein S7
MSPSNSLTNAPSITEITLSVVREELRKAGWNLEELARRPNGDPVKVAVALRLRRETTMTLKWISQQLRMAAWTLLTKRLYEERKANTGRKVAQPRN